MGLSIDAVGAGRTGTSSYKAGDQQDDLLKRDKASVAYASATMPGWLSNPSGGTNTGFNGRTEGFNAIG